MNTSDISLLASPPTSAWPLKLKLGPHLDLLATCDFASSESTNYQENNSVGRLLQTALSSAGTRERVAAARNAIENSNGACGLAWLVLAREGVNSPESAMIYSQRAIDRIKQELHDGDFSDYCIYSYAYTVALADAAEMAFKAGRKRDAIEMLKEQLAADFDDDLWSDCQIILRDQLASLLIQMGEYKEAQTFLYSHPDSIESWHYLNALVHYVISGDCLISRSALASAFKTGTKTVQKLIANDYISATESDHFDQNICSEKAVAAWLTNEMALAWLKQRLSDQQSVISRESVAIAIDNKDKKRWELWDSRETSAAYFMEQESYKEAGKEFKAALREAERIDYSYFPFLNTMTGLLALNQETKLRPISTEELRQKLDLRVEKFNNERAENNGSNHALVALHFQSFATIYKELGDLEAATKYQVKALELAGDEKINAALTLLEIAEISRNLAEILYEQGHYREALFHANQALAKQEQYLGTTHFEEQETLELAHYCCQQLGDQAGAAALSSKIKAIDPFALG